jgi:hypothetical protein
MRFEICSQIFFFFNYTRKLYFLNLIINPGVPGPRVVILTRKTADPEGTNVNIDPHDICSCYPASLAYSSLFRENPEYAYSNKVSLMLAEKLILPFSSLQPPSNNHYYEGTYLMV